MSWFGNVLFNIPIVSYLIVKYLRKNLGSHLIEWEFVSQSRSWIYPGIPVYKCIMKSTHDKIPQCEVNVIGKVDPLRDFRSQDPQKFVELKEGLWGISTYKPKKEFTDAEDDLRETIMNLCWIYMKLKSEDPSKPPLDGQERYEEQRRFDSIMRHVLKSYRKRLWRRNRW